MPNTVATPILTINGIRVNKHFREGEELNQMDGYFFGDLSTN